MFYEFFRWVAIITCYPFQLCLFTRKTYYEDGARRRPWKKGGALVISNHFNFLDYLMNMFVVLPRKLYPVTSEEPFGSKLLTFGMRFFGAIKADRVKKDMRFMDECADLIRRGRLVQIFPEGRNTPDGRIHEFKKSYIVIAHRANCPIIPIVTDGCYGFFKRARIIVGKEIYPSDYITSTGRTPTRQELNAANDAIFHHVLWLREELERRKTAEKTASGRPKSKRSHPHA